MPNMKKLISRISRRITDVQLKPNLDIKVRFRLDFWSTKIFGQSKRYVYLPNKVWQFYWTLQIFKKLLRFC